MENRTDIAIATAEAIEKLIAEDNRDENAQAIDHHRSLMIVRTFIASLRLTAPPKRGRPRNQKGEQ